ncbi:hypothetical protein SASPL_129303 [Salvia splendens]|uniref:Xylosyltransferase n=1 Tax=Salvia splendens TaxID=180675 RepID=A0A8X8XB40_SALSN|nr:hypothetical protein SASPL_129303 [Salvia splendens]
MEISKPMHQRKWLLPMSFSLLTSSLLIILTLFTAVPFRHTPRIKPQVPVFVESKLQLEPPNPSSRIPRLAYLISGSRGDCGTLKRTLRALYHPLNQYVVHLDLEAKAEERIELVEFVKNETLFEKVGNVRVVVKSNLVTYRGPTMVSNTLHAAAILLKECGDWDWFINLSASDYPLVTQDDMLHTLSAVPRDLNFIEHTSDIGWKEYQRAKPVIIDPGLYSVQKSDLYWITEKRKVPTAFKLFTGILDKQNLFIGSAWMMLSRSFMEFCLLGWDNLPRVVLMYYANFLSSPEGYFHTVICNAEEFRNTTVNHDLHFISWDNPPKQHPHFLTVDDYQRMVDSNAPFARKFQRDEAILDKIDSDLLGRSTDGFVPGSWYSGEESNANVTELRPGPGAERLKTLIDGLILDKDFHAKHCI